jgi:hypothetical protein
MEHRHVGRNEVRITKVYTLEPGEFSVEHDPTPNWTEDVAPVRTATPPSFVVRIEAEAGEALVRATTPPAPAYNLNVHVVCLSNPIANLFGNLLVAQPATTFAAANWEHDAPNERYTYSWNIEFPTAGLVLGTQTGELYQAFVLLQAVPDPVTNVMAYASSATSQPFVLL